MTTLPRRIAALTAAASLMAVVGLAIAQSTTTNPTYPSASSPDRTAPGNRSDGTRTGNPAGTMSGTGSNATGSGSMSGTGTGAGTSGMTNNNTNNTSNNRTGSDAQGVAGDRSTTGMDPNRSGTNDGMSTNSRDGYRNGTRAARADRN